jgi:hypothetical protein
MLRLPSPVVAVLAAAPAKHCSGNFFTGVFELASGVLY